MKSKKVRLMAICAIAVFASVIFSACDKMSDSSIPDVYCTISYQTEIGTAPQAQKVLIGTVITEELLPTLTADGYDFDGWYIEDSHVTAKIKYTVTEDITLTAKWTKKSTNPEIDPDDPGQDKPDPENPDKPNPEDPDKPNPQTSKFTVTYESKYGTAPAAKEVEEGTVLIAEDLPTLTAKSYFNEELALVELTFEGWFIGDTSVTKDTHYAVKGNVTLTAKWSEKITETEPMKDFFTVTYVSEYGEAPEEKEVEEGTVLTAADLPTLTSDEYDFGGWYIGETAITAESKYEVKGKVTLTAKWTRIQPGVNIDIEITTGKDFKLSYTQEGSKYTITADEGYAAYRWTINNISIEINTPENAFFTLDTSNLPSGGNMLTHETERVAESSLYHIICAAFNNETDQEPAAIANLEIKVTE